MRAVCVISNELEQTLNYTFWKRENDTTLYSGNDLLSFWPNVDASTCQVNGFQLYTYDNGELIKNVDQGFFT
jgi:hypothetical protein